MTPEGIIKKQICQYLQLMKLRLGESKLIFWTQESVGIFDKERGIYRKKMSLYQMRGVSDILGCIDGKLLAIEVKTPAGRVSPEQQSFIDIINRCGGVAFIARSVDDVKKELTQNTCLTV